MHGYQVAHVARVAPRLTEIALTAAGAAMCFVPGQLAMLRREGKHGWWRHPFTMSGAPHIGVLRFTIRSLGDDTTDIPHSFQPGVPAVVGGRHGRFLQARGATDQIWIAGGVGIASFLSWLRTLDQHPVRGRVALYYAHPGPAPLAEEIAVIAANHDNIHLHVVDSSASGLPHPAAGPGRHRRHRRRRAADPRRLSVLLCGPRGMVHTFTRALRCAVVAGRNVHREHFDWR